MIFALLGAPFLLGMTAMISRLYARRIRRDSLSCINLANHILVFTWLHL